MRSSTTLDMARRKAASLNEIKYNVLKAIKVNYLSDVKVGSIILMDRNPSKLNQIRRRCTVTGRSKGNYRRFKMCRIKVRENALAGNLACVRKLTWLIYSIILSFSLFYLII